MPRPREGPRPVLFNSGLAGAVSRPHRTHFLVLLFLTYVKLSMNSFLPRSGTSLRASFPKASAKVGTFTVTTKLPPTFFMLKSIFSAKREAAPYYIMRAREKGERRGKRSAGRANGRRSPPPCLAESARVLAAEYSSTSRKVRCRAPQGNGAQRALKEATSSSCIQRRPS